MDFKWADIGLMKVFRVNGFYWNRKVFFRKSDKQGRRGIILFSFDPRTDWEQKCDHLLFIQLSLFLFLKVVFFKSHFSSKRKGGTVKFGLRVLKKSINGLKDYTFSFQWKSASSKVRSCTELKHHVWFLYFAITSVSLQNVNAKYNSVIHCGIAPLFMFSVSHAALVISEWECLFLSNEYVQHAIMTHKWTPSPWLK